MLEYLQREWIGVATLAVSSAGLIWGIITFRLIYLVRLKMRLKLPVDGIQVLREHAHPRIFLINRGAIPVHAQRLFFKWKTPTGMSDIELPISNPLAKSDPLLISAHSSTQIEFGQQDLSQLWEHRGELLCELENLRTVRLNCLDRRDLRRYLKTEVKAFDAFARKQTIELEQKFRDSDSPPRD